ncbi:hypothetical protein BB934_45875 (plasmid) [Microvirga ossetica]|uniref:Uncharacterized protein n=1 Tax=Microvirga ossetica TaxID=1882682 RepID=A0A1B2EZY1_9HYPH|nr:hypothetical protein [Microvirga ossetica]ANY85549.1 hypothetical protein BB934_45875 [Microvirga ossetica]
MFGTIQAEAAARKITPAEYVTWAVAKARDVDALIAEVQKDRGELQFQRRDRELVTVLVDLVADVFAADAKQHEQWQDQVLNHEATPSH